MRHPDPRAQANIPPAPIGCTIPVPREGSKMRAASRTGLIAAAFVCLSILSAAEPSYYHDVRPILQRQCQGCHQPNLKSSDLDLTTYEGFAKGGKRGPASAVLLKYVTGEMK